MSDKKQTPSRQVIKAVKELRRLADRLERGRVEFRGLVHETHEMPFLENSIGHSVTVRYRTEACK